MPELPEVQTVVDDLRGAGLIGATVARVRVTWPRSIAGTDAAAFGRRLRGRTVAGVWRRGKYLVMEFAGGPVLLIHLRMSGRLLYGLGCGPLSSHEHVELTFIDGSRLRLHDTRKFARCRVVDDPAAVLGALGPEPLDPGFTPAVFATLLQGRDRMLKPFLLDQSCIAGLGNIYTDEALWGARLHPCCKTSSLRPTQACALHRAIVSVLHRGLRHRGTTLGNGKNNFHSIGSRRGANVHALKVYGRTGLACPRCATPIARMTVAQRGTHLCPHCQRL